LWAFLALLAGSAVSHQHEPGRTGIILARDLNELEGQELINIHPNNYWKSGSSKKATLAVELLNPIQKLLALVGVLSGSRRGLASLLEYFRAREARGGV